jgi:sulfoxide reductase catalytic subunit YedY
MLIKKATDIPSSEITSKNAYLNRRRFLTGAAVAGAAAAAGVAFRELTSPSVVTEANAKIDGIQKSPLSTTEKQTPFKDVTNYNNFYEFSTDKYEPASLAKDFKTRPWKVTIDGLVKNRTRHRRHQKMSAPGPIYRHRCVEGWSIVVPWWDFPL